MLYVVQSIYINRAKDILLYVLLFSCFLKNESYLFIFGVTSAELVKSYFPDQESNQCPLQWKHRVLITGPPGDSLFSCTLVYISLKLHRQYQLELSVLLSHTYIPTWLLFCFSKLSSVPYFHLKLSFCMKNALIFFR